MQGVEQLRSDLADVALKEKYMGEHIPEVWLNFETSMMKFVSFVYNTVSIYTASVLGVG